MPRPFALRPTSLAVRRLTIIGAGVGFLTPRLVAEGQQFAEDLPGYVDRSQVVLDRFPVVEERLRSAVEQASSNGRFVSRILTIGTNLLGGIANTRFVVVLAVYLLLDRERVYGWISGYLKPAHQVKVRAATPEAVKIVSGYVIGQLITSTLFGVFTYTVLAVAGVPAALLLAVLAAVLDAVPMIGTPLATVPAVLLALTVSVPVAVVVLVLYVAYQQVENYLIVPRVYGKSLQVSPIGILVGVFVRGQLLGVLGILLALSVVAAIPVIERVWRQEVIQTDTDPGNAGEEGSPSSRPTAQVPPVGASPVP